MESSSWFAAAFLTCCSLIWASNPLVTVTQGRLSGSWMRTRGRRRIAAFRGIPYATPPVGHLRFESPQPAVPWQGTKSAKRNGNSCVQQYHFLGILGDEDCLYLNVYTPSVDRRKVRENAEYPVLVFIHGGYFKSGSANSLLYGPKFLLDKDIVLVTINYRLGVFGFLSLEDSVLPGNLGLKDQREALRWVRDNIRQFGGDPHKVTLFGESAGAKSVHYHTLFNTEEGLFRAAICHSGTVMSVGGYQRPTSQKPLVNHILKNFACQPVNSSFIVQCLRKVRANDLVKAVLSFMPPSESLLHRVELSPVVEPDCVPDAFVTADPWNRTSSLPMIIGVNKYEGLYSIKDILKDDTDKYFKRYNANYSAILSHNLELDITSDNASNIAETIKEFYFNESKIERSNVLQLVDLLSDGKYIFAAVEGVRHNLNQTFLYSFNYFGSKSILNIFDSVNNYGPSHVDELFMFFPFSLIPIDENANMTEADKVLSEKLVKIWTNFVINLDPSIGEEIVEWKPVSSPALEYLSIDGPDNLTMTSPFYPQRMEFWQNLPFRNKPLIDFPLCDK